MILFSCGFFSVKKVQCMKRKCLNVKELARGLFLLKHEIIYNGREMWEAVGAVADGLKGETKQVFRCLYQHLSQNTAVTLEQAWQASVSPEQFPESVLEYMSAFTKKAGMFSEEQELQHLEQAEKILTEIQRSEEEMLSRNKTLIYTAGVGGGCAVFLLLL